MFTFVSPNQQHSQSQEKEYENVMLQDKTGQMDSKIWDPSSGGICDFDAMVMLQ